MRKQYTFYLSTLLVFLSITTQAQSTYTSTNNNQLTRILFVLDASGSMLSKWGKESKWETAQRILANISDTLSLNKNVETALRVYGHQHILTERNCDDTKLEVSFAKNNGAAIRKKLMQIQPKGITPIALSLEQAIFDFPNTSARNVIILITDGAESCFKDPCEAAYQLQIQGITLKPLIVGIDLPEDARSSYECIGKLFNSKNDYEFQDHIERAIYRALASATLQVELLDENLKATQTNLNMSFYDASSDHVLKNYYHTLDKSGRPDTIDIDPIPKYNIVVHTIPPVRVDNIEIIPHENNIIKINTPQGYLDFQLSGSLISATLKDKLKCIVKGGEYDQIVNVQNFNTNEKYLAGKYQLEILTLPRTIVNNVEIAASKTKTITIPAPGLLQINKTDASWGGIFVFENDWKVKKIYELKDELKVEPVYLQPGKYRIIYRAKKSKSMHQTVDKEFVIESGKTVNLNL
ncbi:MAG: VWA domain-containing protein [Bacteroidota bacterium]